MAYGIDAVTDITATLGGLRSLSAGAGTAIGTRWYQNGRAAPPYDYVCGIIEHQGDPVFWWVERASEDDFDAEFVVDVHVARYHDGAVEYLGTPFKYAEVVGRFMEVLGIAMPILVSDGTNLYCVAQQLVTRPGFLGYESAEAWQLACRRWDGGTSWADYGFDEPLTVNFSGTKDTVPGVLFGDTTEFGFDATPDAEQPIAELGYRCAAAVAVDGAVYASWYETGDTGIIQTGPFHNVFVGTYVDDGKDSLETWLHIAKFTGPGQTSDVIYPFHDVLKIWDGNIFADPPNYVDGTTVTRAVNSLAMGAAGGVPLAVVEYDEFTTGEVDPIPNLEVINLDTGGVIQTDWPNNAWASSGTAEYTSPRQLLWDPDTGVYYTTAADNSDTFAETGAIYWVVSLAADGSAWGLVDRGGVSLPAAENDKDGIDDIFDVPFNRASTWVAFEPVPVLGVESVAVYLLNQSFFKYAGGDFSIYAWLPCLKSVSDSSAWDALTAAPGASPYVAPNPDATETWNRNGPVAAAVKIGSHVYVICAEVAHDATNDDYRVYDITLGNPCSHKGMHIWQRIPL